VFFAFIITPLQRTGNPAVANGVSQLKNLASNNGIAFGMEALGVERGGMGRRVPELREKS